MPGIATAVGLPLLTASPFLFVMLRARRAAGTLPPLGQDWAQITLLLSQMQTSAFICSLTLFPVSKITAMSDLQCAERLGNSLMVTNDNEFTQIWRCYSVLMFFVLLAVPERDIKIQNFCP